MPFTDANISGPQRTHASHYPIAHLWCPTRAELISVLLSLLPLPCSFLASHRNDAMAQSVNIDSLPPHKSRSPSTREEANSVASRVGDKFQQKSDCAPTENGIMDRSNRSPKSPRSSGNANTCTATTSAPLESTSVGGDDESDYDPQQGDKENAPSSSPPRKLELQEATGESADSAKQSKY